jgi:two-component system nitrogen regulation response regulator GlnG
MGDVVNQVEEVAEDDVPVLIEGEPGSGRELVARTIHYAGPRRNAGFVAVKAANIPRALVEGELFGPQKGSLRRASGGTLLLKDVDTLPKGPQRGLAKVLRKRVTSREESGEHLDVRFIGATDGDLVQSVEADYFDRELYDRLGARRIKIPPLRRRADDIPRLVRHFLSQIGEELGRRIAVTDRALTRLARYPWPGNVAELKDVLKRIAVKAKRGPIDAPEVEAVLTPLAERIPAEEMAFEEIVRNKLAGFLRRVDGYPVENLYDDVIARVEKPLLALVLEHTSGNQLKAAEILGLNRNTLRKKLADHKILGGDERRRR